MTTKRIDDPRERFGSGGSALRAIKLALLPSVLLAALALAPSAAFAGPGDLTQKPGDAGCVAQTGLFGDPPPDPLCRFGPGLDNPSEVALSPDRKNAYVATSDGIAIFDRDLTTGALTKHPGLGACISENGGGGVLFQKPCGVGRALTAAFSVTVSPDGRNVYLATSFGVATFDRDAATGALTQKSGLQGCISDTGRRDPDDPDTAGQCANGTAIARTTSIALSPAGDTIYVAAQNSDAVAILDRNTTTGVLTQKAGSSGCISETGQSDPGDTATAGDCQDGHALDSVFSVTAAVDGENVYAVADASNAVTIFDRGASGALTQKTGTAGCVSEDTTGGTCADGKALLLSQSGGSGVRPSPRAVAASADGESVYVSAHDSNSVAIFDRDASGALTQKAGTAGCVSEDGTGGACADGNALDRASGVAVSPDGASVYATSYEHGTNVLEAERRGNGSAVVIFDRDLATGALTQKPGAAGCIQDDYNPNSDPAPIEDSGCATAHMLQGALTPTISADGKDVYVAAVSAFFSVAIFDRELPPDADNDGVIDALDRCPSEAGAASNQGCPVATAGSPGSSGSGVTPEESQGSRESAPAGEPQSSGPVALATSKLETARARIDRAARMLDVLAPISRMASGSVRVELQAAGRRHRFTAPINSRSGMIRFRQRIPRAQAAMGTGILTINYLGDPDTRAQTIRLRAASRAADLRVSRPTIDAAGRLRAAGTISNRARGVVRVQLEYIAGGTTTVLQFPARINNGRWSLNQQLSQTVRDVIARRNGTVHSYVLFTGYRPQQMRGEMRSYQVLGPR